MTGKLAQAGRGVKASDAQSVISMTSMKTVDREKLRDKAHSMQMKENVRMMLCARIQQTFKKSPKLAEELASEVTRIQQQRGLGPDLSDTELGTLVNEICSRRQEQKTLASCAQEVENYQIDPTPTKGIGSGRQSSSRKNRGGSKASAKQARRASSKHITAVSNAGNSVISASAIGDEDVYLTQTQLQQLSTGFRLPPRVSPKKEQGGGIWEEIVKFGTVEEQLEAKRKREEKEKRRLSLAAKLEEQVHERHQQQIQERTAASEYYHQSMDRLKQEEDEERQKELNRLEQAKQLNKIQDEQRRAKMQQQERERQLKKAQELKMAEILKKQVEEEKAREAARKVAEKQRIMHVLHENEEDLKRKHEHQQQEREYEVKLAEDYIKMEEAKDLARRKQLDDLSNNIKARMKIFGDTAKADMDAKAKQDEERVLRYQQEHDSIAAELERKKKEMADARNQSQQEYLKQQMKEKTAREDALKKDLNKQAELWKQERVDAERKEKAIQQQRAIRNQSQQEKLLEQIRDKEKRSLLADQTELEKQLNAKLLDKIHKQVGNGASVVSETQNRSRELQAKEENFLQARQRKL